MKKLILLFILSSFIGLKAKAQVAAISASKLITYNANTIETHYLEVEPSFSWMSSRSAFDFQGNRYFYSADKDSLILSRELYFRGTYSPFKNLEIGTMLTSDLSSLSVGMKYLFFDNKKFAVAFISGINWTGQYTPVNRNGFVPGTDTRVAAYAGGFAFSRQFTGRLSWDTNIQYQNSVSGGHSFQNDYFVDSELGYYVFNHQLQLIGGLAYHHQYIKTTGMNGYLLVFNPGVTIETGKSYVLVLYAPIAISGKNMPIYRGINLAYTIDIK